MSCAKMTERNWVLCMDFFFCQQILYDNRSVETKPLNVPLFRTCIYQNSIFPSAIYKYLEKKLPKEIKLESKSSWSFKSSLSLYITSFHFSSLIQLLNLIHLIEAVLCAFMYPCMKINAKQVLYYTNQKDQNWC